MKRHDAWDATYDIKCVRDGKVVWEDSVKNTLVNDGEQNIGDVYLTGVNMPAQFYLRLCNDSLAVTDNLTTITNEMSLYGYAPLLIPRSTVGWPTKALDSGDWMFTSLQVSMTATGGDIGPFNTLFMATSTDNSGLLIGFVNLAVARIILNGDTMLVNIRIKFA